MMNLRGIFVLSLSLGWAGLGCGGGDDVSKDASMDTASAEGGGGGADKAQEGGATDAGATDAGMDGAGTDGGVPIADIPGVWTGDWGTMVLKKVGDEIWGAYTHDMGTVRGTYSGGLFVGWWCEVPSRMPINDAGDVEFTFTANGGAIALDGRWRYGAEGDFREDWDLAKSDMAAPADLDARFADMTAFCKKP